MIAKEIIERRSIRNFKPDAIPDETILEIIKAAEFAPSAMHIKPIEYVIVKDQAIKNKLHEILGDRFIKDAPVLIIPVSDNGKSAFSIHDIAIASGYMFLQSSASGLGTVWKNLKDDQSEKIKTLLGIPVNYTLINLIPVGYPTETLPAHTDAEFDTGKIHREKF